MLLTSGIALPEHLAEELFVGHAVGEIAAAA